MTRSINAIKKIAEKVDTIYLQPETLEYKFDTRLDIAFPLLLQGDILLSNDNRVSFTHPEPLAIQIHVNLSYQWVDTTRAPRIHLNVNTTDEQISIPYGFYDSATKTNHIDKIFILNLTQNEPVTVSLVKDGGSNVIQMLKNSFISFKPLIN